LLDLIFMDALGFNVSNKAPTVTALVNTISEDDSAYSRNLLDSASDPEADPISVKNLDASVLTTGGRTLVSGIDYTLSGSTITLTGSGFSEFQSLAFNQTDTVIFHYNVVDSLTASTSDTLTLTVNGANDPPVANPDVGAAGENETKAFDVLANDTDVDAVHSFSLVSLAADLVTSANSQVNGINASSAFTIDSNQIKFTPGTLFDPLALGQTATVLVHYTMQDDQAAQASSVLTWTVTGANDPPVIISGGGGDNATYDIKVNFSAITTVVATDVDSGSILSYSIVGGANANLFKIDSSTGALAFKVKPVVPHNDYEVIVQASDQDGGIDRQLIAVNVTDSKMDGEFPGAGADTFAFHTGFGSNSVKNFQLTQDFLQFDKGMFSADTVAAVLGAAHDTKKGDVVIDIDHGNLTIVGVSTADLAANASHILFV
jgi:VCBS repeat-containing protein